MLFVLTNPCIGNIYLEVKRCLKNLCRLLPFLISCSYRYHNSWVYFPHAQFIYYHLCSLRSGCVSVLHYFGRFQTNLNVRSLLFGMVLCDFLFLGCYLCRNTGYGSSRIYPDFIEEPSCRCNQYNRKFKQDRNSECISNFWQDGFLISLNRYVRR